jgi:hypothetical protein
VSERVRVGYGVKTNNHKVRKNTSSNTTKISGNLLLTSGTEVSQFDEKISREVDGGNFKN